MQYLHNPVVPPMCRICRGAELQSSNSFPCNTASSSTSTCGTIQPFTGLKLFDFEQDAYIFTKYSMFQSKNRC